MTSNQIEVLLFFNDLKSLLVLRNSCTDLFVLVDLMREPWLGLILTQLSQDLITKFKQINLI